MDAGQKWSEKLTEALILLRWANLPGTIKQGYTALGRRSEKGCGFPMMLELFHVQHPQANHLSITTK